MGSDGYFIALSQAGQVFQSTLPGWGATRAQPVGHESDSDFNPRSPDGERPPGTGPASSAMNFNPRSPDGERLFTLSGRGLFHVFQSTLPGWGATFVPVCAGICLIISIHAPRMGSDPPRTLASWPSFSISIHAPRMGSDLRLSTRRRRMRNFNPRSPDGERLLASLRNAGIIAFQSTLPGWGATRSVRCRPSSRTYFNPRSPDGERPNYMSNNSTISIISIHAPRMGSDRGPHKRLTAGLISIHAPRMGSDGALYSGRNT